MTLTEAAFWTKKLIYFVGAGFVLFIIFVIVMLSLKKDPTLPQYLTANYACTATRDEFLIHELEIPTLELAPGSENAVFELETLTGKGDQLPRIINMYKYNNPGQSLTSQNEAKVIAQRLGFSPDAIQRRGTTEYYWDDPTNARRLTVQARNLNFKLQTDFRQPNALPTDGELPTEDEAISIARSFLSSAGLLYEDYAKGRPIVKNINIEADGSFSQAFSKRDAELIRVDFVREKSMITIPSNIEGADTMKSQLEKQLYASKTEKMATPDGKIDVYTFDIPVVTLNPEKSNISVYIGPQNKKLKDNNIRNIYGIDYTNWVIDTTSCGTYELIPASTVASLVQEGKGSLIYLNEKNGDDVVDYTPRAVSKFTFFDISLGYYDAPSELSYLQPIYIVSGEATFTNGAKGPFYFYVPAINYDLVTDKVETVEPVQKQESSTNLLN